MSYFAEPNYIEYDEWFDSNIDPIDLIDYLNESEFTNSIHEKFYKISAQNLTIGSSEKLFWLISTLQCFMVKSSLVESWK